MHGGDRRGGFGPPGMHRGGPRGGSSFDRKPSYMSNRD